MNARLYDAVLGRMLSPDNYVQNSEYTQNYNRYSYAYNNPLTNTDPSGNFIFSAFMGPAGAVIDYACWSAVIDLGMQGLNMALGNQDKINWAEVGGAFVGGAISGGLGLVAPSFAGASLGGRYVGKALTTAANAGISAVGGHFAQDLLDDGNINDGFGTYLSSFKSAAITAGAFSLGISAYDYATWDRFSPDEKIAIIKKEKGFSENGLQKIQYDSEGLLTKGDNAGSNSYTTYYSKEGLRVRANAMKAYDHEKYHFTNNDFYNVEERLPIPSRESFAQMETRAHQYTYTVQPYNLPYRHIQGSLTYINKDLYANMSNRGLFRPWNIFFNIIR